MKEKLIEFGYLPHAVHSQGGPAVRVTEAIREQLEATFAPVRLELIDDSARHAGHAGARPEGESHFRVTIVAEAFAGKSRIERHRMVFGALDDLLRTDIHALSVAALTPAEDAARGR